MGKEKKEREQERGPQTKAHPSAFRSLGAHGRSNVFLPRPGSLDGGSHRTPRRTLSHDPARSIAMSKDISSSYSSNSSLLHMAQSRLSLSTPHSGQTQRSPKNQGDSRVPVAHSQTGTQKIEVTQGMTDASKTQATEGKRELTSRHEPSRPLTNRAQLLRPKQWGVVRPPSALKLGHKVTMKGVHRAKKGVIQRINEFLRENRRATQMPPRSVEVPSMSTSSATGQPPLSAPDSAMSTQPPSNAAQAVGPTSTTMEWTNDSTKPDAGTRIEDSGDSAKEKKISGGKARTKSRQKDKTYKGKGDKRVAMGVSTLAANPNVTLVTKSGGSTDNRLFSDGTKDGVALSSSTAEIEMEIDTVPATSSQQTSGDASKGKTISGGKARAKTKHIGNACESKGGSSEAVRDPNLSANPNVVSPVIAIKFGGPPHHALFSDGTKDKVALTSSTAETGMEIDTVAATSSLQTVEGSPQHTQMSENKKAPSATSKQTLHTSRRKKIKARRSVGAQSNKNRVSLESTRVPNPSQLQVSGGSSTAEGFQGSSAMGHMGGPPVSSQETSPATEATGTTGTATSSTGPAASLPSAGKSDMGATASTSGSSPNTGEANRYPPGTPGWLIYMYEVYSLMPDPVRLAMDTTASSVSTTQGHDGSTPFTGSQPGSQDPSTSQVSKDTDPSGPGITFPGGQAEVQHRGLISDTASSTAHLTTAPTAGPSSIAHPETESSSGKAHEGRTGASEKQNPATDMAAGPTGTATSSTAAAASLPSAGKSDMGVTDSTSGSSPNTGEASQYPPGTPGWLIYMYEVYSLMPDPIQLAKDTTASSVSTIQGQDGNTPFTGSQIGSQDPSTSQVSKDTGSSGSGLILPRGQTEAQYRGPISDTATSTADVTITPNAGPSSTAPQDTQSSSGKAHQGRQCASRTVTPAVPQATDSTAAATTSAGTTATTTLPGADKSDWGATASTSDSHSKMGETGIDQEDTLGLDILFGEVDAGSVLESEGAAVPPKSSHDTKERQDKKAPVRVSGGIAGKKRKSTTSEGTPSEGNRDRGARAEWGGRLEGAPNDRTSFTDTKSGDPPFTTLASDSRKSRMASTLPSAEMKEGDTQSTATSLQTLEGAHVDIQVSVVKSTGKKTLRNARERKIRVRRSKGKAFKKSQASTDSTSDPSASQFLVSVCSATPVGIQGSSETTPLGVSTGTSASLATASPAITSGSAPASTKAVSAACVAIATTDLQEARDSHQHAQVCKAPQPSGIDKDSSKGIAGKKREAPKSKGSPCEGKRVILEVDEDTTWPGTPDAMSPVPDTKSGRTLVTESSDVITTGARTVTATIYLPPGRDWKQDQETSVPSAAASTGKQLSGAPGLGKSRAPRSLAAAFKKRRASSASTGLPSSRKVRLPVGSVTSAGTRGSPTKISNQSTSPAAQSVVATGTVATSEATTGTCHPTAGISGVCEADSLIAVLQTVSLVPSTTQGTASKGHSDTALSPGALHDREPGFPSSQSDSSIRMKATTISCVAPYLPAVLEEDSCSNATLSRGEALSSLPSAGDKDSCEVKSLIISLHTLSGDDPNIAGIVDPDRLVTAQSTSGFHDDKVPTPRVSDSDPSRTTIIPAGALNIPQVLGARPPGTSVASGATAPSSLPSAGKEDGKELESLIGSFQAMSFHVPDMQETEAPGHSATALSRSGVDTKTVPMPPTSDSDPEERSMVTRDSSAATPSPGALVARPYLNDRLSRRKASSTLPRDGTGLKHALVSLIDILQKWRQGHRILRGTVAPGHSATVLTPSGTYAKMAPMPSPSDSNHSERSKVTTVPSNDSPSLGAVGMRPYLNDRMSRRNVSSTLHRAGTGLKHESVSLIDILQKWRQGHRILRGTVAPGHSATDLTLSGTYAKMVPMHSPSERNKVTTGSSTESPSPGAVGTRPYLNDRLSRRKASSTLFRAGTGLKLESVSLIDILQKWRQGHRILRGTVAPGHCATVLSISGTGAKMIPMPSSSDSVPEERSKVTTVSCTATPSPGAMGTRPYLNDRLSRRKASSTVFRAGTGLKYECVSLIDILQKWRQGHQILRRTVTSGYSATTLSPSGINTKVVPMPPTSYSDLEERSKVTRHSSAATPSPGALGARPYLNDRLSRRKASSTLPRAGTSFKHESVSLIGILQKWRQGHRLLRGSVTPWSRCHCPVTLWDQC